MLAPERFQLLSVLDSFLRNRGCKVFTLQDNFQECCTYRHRSRVGECHTAGSSADPGREGEDDIAVSVFGKGKDALDEIAGKGICLSAHLYAAA